MFCESFVARIVDKWKINSKLQRYSIKDILLSIFGYEMQKSLSHCSEVPVTVTFNKEKEEKEDKEEGEEGESKEEGAAAMEEGDEEDEEAKAKENGDMEEGEEDGEEKPKEEEKAQEEEEKPDIFPTTPSIFSPLALHLQRNTKLTSNNLWNMSH